MSKLSPSMRTLVDQVDRDLVLIPRVTSYFNQSKFPDLFSVSFRKLKAERKPDGWFHPSTHPLMTERQLYYYLTDPERWEREQIAYSVRMSMLMGSALHDFVEISLLDLGILVEPTGICINCKREHGRGPGQCPEHGAIDEELGTRGHMDGVLRVAGRNIPEGLGGFEFKTSNGFMLKEINDNDVEAFRKKWPKYYAQIQEYLRMTGMRFFIVLFLGQGHPWEMREFLVPRDEMFMEKIRAKYDRVRRYVKIGEAPEFCCTPRSKQSTSCPALSCPIKVM